MAKRTGTLRLLVFIGDANGPFIEAQYLGMTGAPPDAGGSGPMLDDIELGDYDCDSVPEMPRETGLWLLTWPWKMVRHPDDHTEQTAKYATEGTWARPSIDDLCALGALPLAARPTREG
jgi:hypothetical protein